MSASMRRWTLLRIALGIALTTAAMSIAQTAIAQQASTTGTATALFDQGVALMEKGKFSEACPKFARSNELAPNGGTLFALAECYDSNGQVASAWITYKEASIRATAARREEAVAKANAAAAKLEPRVARVTVDVPAASEVKGLAITLDGRSVARAEWGVATPLDPGPHAIEATAPGYKPLTRSLTVDAKTLKQVITIPPLEAAPLPPPSSSTALSPDDNDPPRGRTQRILGIGMGAVGIAGIAVGTIFGLQASSKNDDASSHCRGDNLCDSEGIRLDKEGRDAATISTISFIAGGALLAGGVVLFLTAPSGKKREQSAAVTSLRIRPTPGGSVLTLGASF
jgi:hypothetical protein